MKLSLLKMSFFSGYVWSSFFIVIGGIMLLAVGALLIYFGRSKVGKRNAFLLIVYRLVQLYFIMEVIYLIVMLSVQLFSFKPYTTNKRSGASFGFLSFADGYHIPVKAKYRIPEKKVFITSKVGGKIYSFNHESQFSRANNLGKEYVKSMAQAQLPVMDGKGQVSYIRNDTIRNMISIPFPDNRKRFTADHKPIFEDSSITFVPPSYSYTEASIRSSSAWKNFVFSLFTYIQIFSWLAVTFFLLRILSSFREEQLFTRKNFSYVGYIGITLMLYQVLNFILAFICYKWVVGPFFIRGSATIAHYEGNMSAFMTISADFSFSLFITGFLIVLLSQVFKKGFDLQKEQDLTV